MIGENKLLEMIMKFFIYRFKRENKEDVRVLNSKRFGWIFRL